MIDQRRENRVQVENLTRSTTEPPTNDTVIPQKQP